MEYSEEEVFDLLMELPVRNRTWSPLAGCVSRGGKIGLGFGDGNGDDGLVVVGVVGVVGAGVVVATNGVLTAMSNGGMWSGGFGDFFFFVVLAMMMLLVLVFLERSGTDLVRDRPSDAAFWKMGYQSRFSFRRVMGEISDISHSCHSAHLSHLIYDCWVIFDVLGLFIGLID